MNNLLETIDREDLETLWKLVKDKHGNTRPKEGYERVLWGNLKVMFKLDIESEVWRQLQGYDVTVCKLYSSSGVHFVRFKNLHIFMLVDKAYPLTPATITKMLERKLQAAQWNEMCCQLLKLMLKQQSPVRGCDRLVSRAKVIENQVSIAPEVGVAIVFSPIGVLELDTYSLLEGDPSESSPPPVFVALIPFLCSDDLESDTKIPERHVSPTPHDATLNRWRTRVALRSSSPTTSIPEILTAPILPAPSAIVAPSSEFPLAPVTLPSHHLALRYTSHHLDHFTSGSSLNHLSSDHSSSGHSSSSHSLSEHTPPGTTDTDSSTPPRFVHPPLARISRCSEAYLCWRSAPLSTMYPPTTSESSAGDSSSKSFAGLM
nr:hypothetical protein [Tanacetum cinerariifolium]